MNLIGLMSGTSLDGIDAAVVRLEESGPGRIDAWAVPGFHTRPYSEAERRRIREAIARPRMADLCRLRVDLSDWFAEAAEGACAAAGIRLSEIDLAGSHGQTMWHEPPREGALGASLQLGDPARLAAALGADVVSDFRSADLAAGGQGAPLVPWADRVLFGGGSERRAIQNLGGMGNVTLLSPGAERAACVAFDTGPGVALLDAVAALASGGREVFDRDGVLASRGVPDEGLLAELLGAPFFALPPPRSTGREEFGDELARSLVERFDLQPGSDPDGWSALMATLVLLTARSIGDAYRQWVIPHGLDAVYLMGGGARNPVLAGAIESELDPVPVRSGRELGIDPDAREAVAFALLAWAHVRGVAGNVPEATGANGPRVLGSFTPAPDRPR